MNYTIIIRKSIAADLLKYIYESLATAQGFAGGIDFSRFPAIVFPHTIYIIRYNQIFAEKNIPLSGVIYYLRIIRIFLGKTVSFAGFEIQVTFSALR